MAQHLPGGLAWNNTTEILQCLSVGRCRHNCWAPALVHTWRPGAATKELQQGKAQTQLGEIGERLKSPVEKVKKKQIKWQQSSSYMRTGGRGEVKASCEDSALTHCCCTALVLQGEGEKPFPILLSPFARCPKQMWVLQPYSPLLWASPLHGHGDPGEGGKFQPNEPSR